MTRTLGIILAGGKSTRLYPATFATSKQVLPVFDKPMIYYPLTTLMLADIRDVVVITNREEKEIISSLLWDKEESMGLRVSVLVQNNPVGLPDAFNVVRELNPLYLQSFDRFVLILGDNIFYGASMTELLGRAISGSNTTIFTTKVKDPERFGVAEIKDGVVVGLEEKPTKPKSDTAVIGLYVFNKDVFQRIKDLKPSSRNELEIIDLLKTYLDEGRLDVVAFLRGMIWLDTGTPESLLEASNLIHNIQKHQGYMIGSPHEVAFKKDWVSRESILQIANLCLKSSYGQYLMTLVEETNEQ